MMTQKLSRKETLSAGSETPVDVTLAHEKQAGDPWVMRPSECLQEEACTQVKSRNRDYNLNVTKSY